MNTREEDLAYALLWLRNHFELGDTDIELRQMVIDRIDRVLADGPPITGAIGVAFRKKYTLKGLETR